MFKKMDDYVIGSVADLISNDKRSKIKLRKGKLKTQIKDEKINTEDEKMLLKTLKSKKNYFIESQTSEENITGKFPSKRKKSMKTLEVDSVQKNKKKLTESSSNVTGADDVPKCKDKENVHNLDHVVRGDEEGKMENAEEILKEKKKYSDKQKAYEDFIENTVFVGNIPISYDKKKIYKLFSKFGEILSARIRCVPIAEINMNKKVAAIKKQYNPKRNSLVAYVKYNLKDSAKAALKANGIMIDGHHIRVDLAEQNKERDRSKAVFIGGLPFDIEDDELWEFFQNCGPIESVRVIRDSHTSMGKGFGYVNFNSTASVELALRLDGQELKKRKINVKRCTKAKNKKKLNSFSKKISKEIKNNILSKKEKKFIIKEKKFKKEESKVSTDFQGRIANVKHKKKKKLSKATLHQRKLMKILGAPQK